MPEAALQRVIVDGRRLEAPSKPGDCTCVSCSVFRAGHYLLGAIVATALLPIPVLILWDASRLDLRSEGAIVGGLLIITTGWAVIALTRWYRPVRRLVHRIRPRSLAWPPLR